jgi:NAD(P)-dependent dehydrogenase (short-subunit alcohol dehydrogenase family)
MNIDFAGKVILVAGGTGGLGKAVSLAFLAEGAKVIVTYRAEGELAALKGSAGNGQSSLEGYSVDLTKEEETAQFIAKLVAKYGRLDAVINTVGGYAGGIKMWEMKSDVLEKMLALNVRSGYNLAHAAMPVMLKQGHGSILNVASKAAVEHAAGASAYAASKAAAVALMDSLAADAKSTGVRVNSILPSIIDTKANREAMPGADFSIWPKPEEIAAVVLFLCSDQAKLIQGAAIPVYGDS